MKILWIVNMVLPELADHLNISTGSSGTWMFDLSKKISESDNIELAIACVYGNEFEKYTVNGTTYYTLPGNGHNMLRYTKDYESIWQQINNDFKPDIVHLHGTEYSHGLSFLRSCPDVPSFLSIQGVISKIGPVTFDGISFIDYIKNRTLKETIKCNGIFENKLLFKKNSKYEQEIIKRVRYATGRTFWDKCFMQTVNPNIKYFRCNYNLRDEFYKAEKWDINKIERHAIYGSTSFQSAAKGGLMLLKAVNIVKNYYHDVKVYVILSNHDNGRYTSGNSFRKYMLKMIKQYDLIDNIICFSPQKAPGIISYMEKCNVAVIPSAMENASATLREAMHLGVPSIAAYRGGMTELVKDGESGFFFDFKEYEYLAGRIMQIFEDDDLAQKLSENAIKSAEVWHQREKNVDDMINVYKEIYRENK